MTNVHKCPNCGGFPVDRPGPLETENERLCDDLANAKRLSVLAYRAFDVCLNECEQLKEKCGKLNSEVERLAEGRCIDHATAPAVDGCGVCVRVRLATAIELLREVEAQWGENYLWVKWKLSEQIAALRSLEREKEQGEAREWQVDWTVNPKTHRSNSSPEFQRLVSEVAHLIQDEAHNLLSGRVESAAQLIMAQLAHKHGLAPRTVEEERASHGE